MVEECVDRGFPFQEHIYREVEQPNNDFSDGLEKSWLYSMKKIRDGETLNGNEDVYKVIYILIAKKLNEIH